MTSPLHTYKQSSKDEARRRLLATAVSVLTTTRLKSPIVIPNELATVVGHALAVLKSPALSSAVELELRTWNNAYTHKVGSRDPADLSVLYLCGPEPLNDLRILLDLGIDPTNVWAVDSSARNVASAVSEVASSGLPVKLHQGNLKDFFRTVPQTFDLVYYDACGHLLGRKPQVLSPIIELAAGARLTPLSVLVTNLAAPPPEETDRYAGVLSTYFRFRHMDQPAIVWKEGLDPAVCEHDPRDLKLLVARDLQPFYSDFVTRFITDLFRSWIPNCRCLALTDVAGNYLAKPTTAKEVLVKAQAQPDPRATIEEIFASAGDMTLAPSSYPIFSFYRELIRSQDPIVSILGNVEISGRRTHESLGLASLLDRVFEGHWSAVAPEMIEAIRESWFDFRAPFSTDVPLPNLLINSLLGVYGYPYIPNTRLTTRLRYTSKQTEMSADLFVFDQCRYYFDWFPTIKLAPYRFRSHAFQVVARCMIDRLNWTDWRSSSHPFRGGAVVPLDEGDFGEPYELPDRLPLSD